MASPHSWGDAIKTCYSSHLAAAYGNVPTIEGVTCFLQMLIPLVTNWNVDD